MTPVDSAASVAGLFIETPAFSARPTSFDILPCLKTRDSYGALQAARSCS